MWGHSREAWLCRIRFEQAGPNRWGALGLFPGRRFTCLTCTQVSWKEGGLTGAVSRAGLSQLADVALCLLWG